MNRDDLRVWKPDCCGIEGCGWDHPVSDAELAEMGYVANTLLWEAENALEDHLRHECAGERPVCGECDGSKIDYCGSCVDEGLDGVGHGPCLSCGGTGKGRLVNLTGIDMEALRLAVADVEMAEAVTPNILWLAARQVLAALDKGDT